MGQNHWMVACAAGNLGFVVFHLAFWRLFDWGRELAKLNRINRAVMQILNLRLTYVFALFAAMQLIFPDVLLSTPAGRFLLAGMALFWAMRAVEQIVFFGLRHRASFAIFLLFLLMTGLHAIPLLQ